MRLRQRRVICKVRVRPCAAYACIGCKGEECLSISQCKNDFVFDEKGGGGLAIVWRQKDLKLSPVIVIAKCRAGAIISVNLC